MAYHVTKDLKAEIKVGGSLFLKDLMGLILFPAIMYFLTGAIVADGLKIVYIVYNVIVVLALLQRPKSNPGKQVWQIFLLMMKEDEQTYHGAFFYTLSRTNPVKNCVEKGSIVNA